LSIHDFHAPNIKKAKTVFTFPQLSRFGINLWLIENIKTEEFLPESLVINTRLPTQITVDSVEFKKL
jgi:hypothetical protein